MSDRCDNCGHEWHGLACTVEWFDWTGQHRCPCASAWEESWAPARATTRGDDGDGVAA